MADQLEAELEGKFRQQVKLHGGYTIKLAPTESGVPDRLVVFPGGRMYLVELKTEDGTVSPIQRHWHARLAARGAPVHVLFGLKQMNQWIGHVVDNIPASAYRHLKEHQ